MELFFSIVIVLVALALVFIVLIQNSKGGGLASGFASSNQVMGVRKTTDFLEKATWVLALIPNPEYHGEWQPELRVLLELVLNCGRE
jgi:protein translocase SecG subunit